MGIVDKLKKIVNIDEDEYYDDVESNDLLVYSPDEEEEKEPPRKSILRADPKPAPSVKTGSNKIVDIHTTAKLQVVLTKPERFEDGRAIADDLNDKRTVVLNLESASREVARRLVDFLSGVAYANGGQLKRIANSTFIITPYNVDVMGDLLDELESNGVFFV
ncbi:MAG: cell division protein SepF [Acutalibacteraceae bacterium]|jgi:cell division inhibitor SepF